MKQVHDVLKGRTYWAEDLQGWFSVFISTCVYNIHQLVFLTADMKTDPVHIIKVSTITIVCVCLVCWSEAINQDYGNTHTFSVSFIAVVSVLVSSIVLTFAFHLFFFTDYPACITLCHQEDNREHRRSVTEVEMREQNLCVTGVWIRRIIFVWWILDLLADFQCIYRSEK